MTSDYIKDITEKTDIVKHIGEYIKLSEKNGEYVGLCPFHNEKTPSFYVNPDEKKWYCFGCKQGGNVISFTAKINQISYEQASQMFADKCGIEVQHYTPCSAELVYRKVSRSKLNHDSVNHDLLDKHIYDMYTKTAIPLWANEGIQQSVMDSYEIRMDLKRGRIVYPVYDNEGNFINIKGRTIYPDYKQLGEPKYMNYFKIGKMDYMQCYSHNAKYIHQKKEIIIVEGIKSVMKLDGWGTKHCVSTETSKINDYQLRQLVKMRCNVVVAYDNDVDYRNIKDTLNTLAHFTNVSVIEDVDNLLGENKMSPVDRGEKVWTELYRGKRRLRV